MRARCLPALVGTLALGGSALSGGCSDAPDPTLIGLGAAPATGGVAGSDSSAARSGVAVGGGGAGGSSGGGGLSGRGGSPTVIVEIGGEGGEKTSEAGGAAGAPDLDRDDACALATTTVEAVPPLLELVVDTSGSMNWPPGWAPTTPDDSKPPGATKWEITREALRGALESLDAEIAVGTIFYPNTTGDDPDSLCLREEVALPLDWLGSASSKQRQRFGDALDAVVPNGATPTEGAYRFGLEQLAKTDLTGNRFLLLLTDGTPTCTIDCECTEDNLPVDAEPLLDATDDALDDDLRTFVIGAPGSEDTRSVLSAIARKGGTAPPGCSDDGPDYCHFDMTTESDLAGGLTRALEAVAQSLRSCTYPVPEAPDDATLDPTRVNVLFTPHGGKTETIPQAPSSSKCKSGWQYSSDRKSIELCGSTCEAAKADVGAKVEILLGCKTVTEEPR